MKKKVVLSILLLSLSLSGCQKASEKQGAEPTTEAITAQIATFGTETTQPEEETITIDDREYTVSEINEGIKTVFNDELYYTGFDTDDPFFYSNVDLMLGKPITYDLYYRKYSSVLNPANIYLVVTNQKYPLDTEENFLYVFGIKITEQGMQSDFFEMNHIPVEDNGEYDKSYLGRYRGSYTMCIDEIVPPSHEVMNDAWKENVESALKIYMDENDFSAIKEDNLPLGNYQVYIEGFSPADENCYVFFEHEDGRIFQGFYYFVHNANGGLAADLNKVQLAEYLQEDEYQYYMEKIRQNAAFSMEYSVTKQGGQ